jgi:hypothetical protein
MSSKYAVVLTLILAIGSRGLFPQVGKGESGHNLKLTAHRTGGPIAEANGSFLYTGELSNESAVGANVEAVQMPGGYAGSGKFFACSLQIWDGAEQRWVLKRPARLSNYGKNPNVASMEVRPGTQEEVCRMVLPAQSGKDGACARFLFRLKWHDAGSPVLSNPFIIGSHSLSGTTPCQNASSAVNKTPDEVAVTYLAFEPWDNGTIQQVQLR